MSNRRDIQFMYSPHNKATVLDCNFVVDKNNGNGFGVRSLKASGRISSVYMHSTPAATTATSVFASGVSIIQLSSVVNIVPGEVVTDSTTGGNISGGTTVLQVFPAQNQIQLSAPTAGASAASPGDTLSFAMVPGLVGNPNPEAGIIVVNLQDNYNRYLGGYAGWVSPLSGTPISSGMTVGVPYVIVSLGGSTQAQWVAAGLSQNIQAAVGASFIAQATSVSGGGLVEASAASGIDHVEVIGDPNVMNSAFGPAVLGVLAGSGMQIISACYLNSTITAPADGTVIGLNFYLNNSAQGV
jgi:hypothetical protein